MSAPNINQSLDAIIASTGGAKRTPNRRPRNSKPSGGVKKSTASSSLLKKSGNGSGSGSSKRKTKGSNNNSSSASAALAASGLANLAKRVVVSGMPRDVDEKQVKDFFSNRIGSISSCEGSFTSAGKPTGTFTITYRKEGHALQTFQKFNGTPIDGGKLKMEVRLLVDPVTPAAPARTLADRLGTGKTRSKAGKSATTVDKQEPKKAKEDANKSTAKSGKSRRRRGGAVPKRTAKSAEELDAEMSDYFAAAERSEISV